MIYIKNESNDPFFNLALEEYIIKRLKSTERYILLWQNKPSVIVGRFQNTIEEINVGYVKAKNICVVRRISGGGAVYHDLGNLNYTFVSREKESEIGNFEQFVRPVINVLRLLNVPAEFTGRNDITVEGKKVSGNAQYYYQGRVLHHGTLLFDANLKELQNSLNVSPKKVISRGIKSVCSKVANIVEYLPQKILIEDFKNVILKQIFDYYGEPFREYRLTEKELEEVKKLVREKYLTWEWNYGVSPDFGIKTSKRFSIGKIDILLYVKRGIIKECKISGDFFGYGDVADIEKKLVGKRYCEEDLQDLFKDVELKKYFGDISTDDFLGLIFD